MMILWVETSLGTDQNLMLYSRRKGLRQSPGISNQKSLTGKKFRNKREKY